MGLLCWRRSRSISAQRRHQKLIRLQDNVYPEDDPARLSPSIEGTGEQKLALQFFKEARSSQAPGRVQRSFPPPPSGVSLPFRPIPYATVPNAPLGREKGVLNPPLPSRYSPMRPRQWPYNSDRHDSRTPLLAHPSPNEPVCSRYQRRSKAICWEFQAGTRVLAV